MGGKYIHWKRRTHILSGMEQTAYDFFTIPRTTYNLKLINGLYLEFSMQCFWKMVEHTLKVDETTESEMMDKEETTVVIYKFQTPTGALGHIPHGEWGTTVTLTLTRF